jgi:CBS domain-containing protein
MGQPPTALYRRKRALSLGVSRLQLLRRKVIHEVSGVSDVPTRVLINKSNRYRERGEKGMSPQVFDRMTTQLVTIEPSTSVVEAAQRMIQQVKMPLPVVEGDRPIAMVTDRDIISRVVADGRDPHSVTVQEIATGELVTITPDQDVEAARRLMDEHQLDRILVVEGERLVGIISEADIRAGEGPLA